MAQPDFRERDRRRNGPMHGYFGLSYAAFLVVPRLMIQEMPVEWQERLIALLREAKNMWPRGGTYNVQRRGDNGKLLSDPWRDYRHSTTQEAHATDKKLGLHNHDKELEDHG